MLRIRLPMTALAGLLALSACGDDSHGHDHDVTSTPDATTTADVTDAIGMPDLSGGDTVAPAGLVSHEDLAGGVTATTIDASDADAWVYLDLAGRAQVTPTDPATDTTWDLAFQRFRVIVNGGISGRSDVAVAILDDADFDALTEAPADGWITDAEDSDDADADADLAFSVDGAWYVYDSANHTLAPRPDRVYVVRDRAGDHFKVRIVDYYDDAGSAGEVTFHWAPVAAPVVAPPADQVVIAAPDGPPTYVDAGAAAVVAPADPATSTGWDFAIVGLGFATNSGTSGPGHAGAAVAADAYEDVTATDTVGFAVDTTIPLPGPPGSGEYSGNPVLADWFDYDGQSHTVWPKDQAFIVRGADGGYTKLAIIAQAGADWTFRVAPVARVPEIHTLSLSAPSGGDPVYVSLRQGGLVEVDDAAVDGRWDVAFQYLTLRTNGGTSGGGQGAAAALPDTAFDTVGELPGEVAWIADTMIPVPGPPGSGEISGNAALGAWYDYNPQTHVVSATANKTFLVRAADGSVAKLGLTASNGTDYAIQWVYAGPGYTTFGGDE